MHFQVALFCICTFYSLNANQSVSTRYGACNAVIQGLAMLCQVCIASADCQPQWSSTCHFLTPCVSFLQSENHFYTISQLVVLVFCKMVWYTYTANAMQHQQMDLLAMLCYLRFH